MRIFGYLKLFVLITYYNMKSRSIYRANFLLSMFQSLLTSVVFIGTIWIVLNRFNDINGWNLYEIGFMLGIAKFIHSITLMFFSTLWFLDSMVNYGGLDRFLVRPRSPLFLLVFQRIEIIGIWDTLTSLVIVIFSAVHSGIEWNFANICFVVIFAVSSWVIFFCITFLTGLFSFWFLKTNSLRDFTNLMYNNIIPYPLSVYGKKLQYLFTFLIPIGFIYYYPSLHLFGKSDIVFPDYIAYLSPAVAVVMAIICSVMWKLGLRNYKSAGN
ncbi:MAG TPA: ABC-2 family transporter protein [Clostridia bacterium]|nr:ABC-2 family transporter protein [Clostridia bacterium]